jgi:amidophosphoribosyltransferase
MIFKAVEGVHRRVKGAYAVVAMIAGYGLLAFRDPFGIRPLIIGRADTEKGVEFMVASESVALDTLGFKVMRDVAPARRADRRERQLPQPQSAPRARA